MGDAGSEASWISGHASSHGSRTGRRSLGSMSSAVPATSPLGRRRAPEHGGQLVRAPRYSAGVPTEAEAKPSAVAPAAAGLGRPTLALLVAVAIAGGAWLGRGTTKDHPTFASQAENPAASEAREEAERVVAQWEAHVAELTSRLAETREETEELRLEREAREAAEKRLEDCKAFGPSYC